jgi:hypothetical protein
MYWEMRKMYLPKEFDQLEYFRIQQDHRVSGYPKFADPSILTHIEPHQHVYCESVKQQSTLGNVTLPFMDRPVFIISKELKSLFSAYQEGAEFFPFFTKDVDGKGLPYYVFHPLILNCLSEEAEYLSGKRDVKKLLLDRNKIRSNKVFQVGGIITRYLIVDLEILELMLYNGIFPFLFMPASLSGQVEV